jgi:hypothetical protein
MNTLIEGFYVFIAGKFDAEQEEATHLRVFSTPITAVFETVYRRQASLFEGAVGLIFFPAYFCNLGFAPNLYSMFAIRQKPVRPKTIRLTPTKHVRISQ